MRRSFSLFFCLPLLFLFLAAACRIPSAASVRPSAATQAPIMAASRDHKTRWMEVLGSDPWRALVQFRARVLALPTGSKESSAACFPRRLKKQPPAHMSGSRLKKVPSLQALSNTPFATSFPQSMGPTQGSNFPCAITAKNLPRPAVAAGGLFSRFIVEAAALW